MSEVYLIDNEGEVTIFSYSLPPFEAIKACVTQEVLKIRNFISNEVDVPITESANGYLYQFGDNSAVWVRKQITRKGDM